MGEKTCRTCGETKPIERFRLRADRRARRPHCNQCLYARANASLAGQRARERYVLKTKYGITVEEYDQRVVDQMNLCAICNGPPKANSRLYVDHCHSTQIVRGLLCNTCNAGLGQFRDDPDLLLAALEYLKNGGF